jgi:glycosyltransferase involved in cell wall biosynthesis
MKIALVHELLTQMGGAERVLSELHAMFPSAPVFTLLADENKLRQEFAGWNVKTSFLQRLPRWFSYKWFLPLMTTAVASFDLSGFDLVISDASAFAKGVKIRSGQKHICYCHTPTRYLWQDRESYVNSLPYAWPVKLCLKPLLAYLRRWDYKAAQKPDLIIANSQEVKGRIWQFYGRDSLVVCPPVDTDFFTPGRQKQNFFLTGGRLEPYKRIDLAILACNELKLPLTVFGAGSQEKYLKSLAGPTVQFAGRISDEELRNLYRSAKALIFPALEDAGMMLVEALACATPVIAYGKGGALDFIEPGKHGEFFYEQTLGSLKQALQKFNERNYTQTVLTTQALRFGRKNFQQGIINAAKQLNLNL